MLWGAFRNLHPIIVLHPLMLYMALLPEETLRLMMSIIEMLIWELQRPIVRINLQCDCNVAPYTALHGYCGETVEGAQMGRRLGIHYNQGLSHLERAAARIL
jgi:hypothetical protein